MCQTTARLVEVVLFVVAQTNLQFFNQMRAQNRPESDYGVIRAAYDLACLLYSGYYQADGKPFISHSVGVASTLSHLGLPAPIVALGLLHNIYGNGNFGDGRIYRVTPERQRRVRDAVGEEVETLVRRFSNYRASIKTISRIEADLDGYDETERHLLTIDLANYLEKYVDLGVLYFGDASWITDEVSGLGARLPALADRLGHAELATVLRQAFAAAAQEPPVPAALRRPPEQKYPALIMPLSAGRTLRLRARSLLRKLRGR